MDGSNQIKVGRRSVESAGVQAIIERNCGGRNGRQNLSETTTAQGSGLFPWSCQWGGCLLAGEKIVELRLRKPHYQEPIARVAAAGLGEKVLAEAFVIRRGTNHHRFAGPEHDFPSQSLER